MCLDTKFQPFPLRNDKRFERATWRAKEQLGLPVTVLLWESLQGIIFVSSRPSTCVITLQSSLASITLDLKITSGPLHTNLPI